MINVVPSNVTLTSQITLLPVKAHAVQLTFERNKLVFKASLRVNTLPASRFIYPLMRQNSAHTSNW